MDSSKGLQLDGKKSSRDVQPVSTLAFTGLSYSVKVKGQPDKKLIDDVSVSVRAGELLGASSLFCLPCIETKARA
jgi:hypothetical protein